MHFFSEDTDEALYVVGIGPRRTDGRLNAVPTVGQLDVVEPLFVRVNVNLLVAERTRFVLPMVPSYAADVARLEDLRDRAHLGNYLTELWVWQPMSRPPWNAGGRPSQLIGQLSQTCSVMRTSASSTPSPSPHRSSHISTPSSSQWRGPARTQLGQKHRAVQLPLTPQPPRSLLFASPPCAEIKEMSDFAQPSQLCETDEDSWRKLSTDALVRIILHLVQTWKIGDVDPPEASVVEDLEPVLSSRCEGSLELGQARAYILEKP